MRNIKPTEEKIDQPPKPMKIFIPKPISQNKKNIATNSLLKQLDVGQLKFEANSIAMKPALKTDDQPPQPNTTPLLFPSLQPKEEERNQPQLSSPKPQSKEFPSLIAQSQIKIYVPEDSTVFLSETKKKWPRRLDNLSGVHKLLVLLFNNEPVTMQDMDLESFEVSIIFEFLFRKDKSLKPEKMWVKKNWKNF